MSQPSLLLRRSLTIAVEDVLPGEIVSIATEILCPLQDKPLQSVLFCVPGGGRNRNFFDLRSAESTRFSFAHAMLARNHMVVLIDPPGVGESPAPNDGYALTVDVVADAIAKAARALVDRLRTGDIDPAFAPADPQKIVGVGHSMGAILTILQQHRHKLYDGLVLLGLGARGLPSFLNDAEKALAHNPDALRAQIHHLAQTHFGTPFLEIDEKHIRPSPHADPGALAMLAHTIAPTSTVCTIFVLVPGSFAPEAAALRAPSFVGIGQYDFAGSADDVPAILPAVKDLTVVTIPDAGHNLVVFPSCQFLFEQVGAWLERF